MYNKTPRIKADAHKKVLMKIDTGICLKGWLTDKIGFLYYAAIRFYLIELIEMKRPFSHSACAPMLREKGMKKAGD